MKNIIKRLKNPHRLSITDYLRLKLFSRFYLDLNKDFHHTILVAGEHRSGTTWLGEMLSKYFHYRFMFEPFHPDEFPEYEEFVYRYIPPDLNNKQYYEKFSKIFRGNIKSEWVDRDNRFFVSKGRVIKFIRINLMLGWIRENFPELPIVFIIRHPCAVVSSRLMVNWDPFEFDLILEQEDLINKFLGSYLDFLEKPKTKLEKLVCLWCIENMVPLKMMSDKKWHVVAYENLVINLEKEFKKIVEYIEPDLKFNPSKVENEKSILTTDGSALLNDIPLLEVWKHRLNSEQIKKILEIVKIFSMDSLYSYETIGNIENFDINKT